MCSKLGSAGSVDVGESYLKPKIGYILRLSGLFRKASERVFFGETVSQARAADHAFHSACNYFAAAITTQLLTVFSMHSFFFSSSCLLLILLPCSLSTPLILPPPASATGSVVGLVFVHGADVANTA